jgi:hypothetical protein
MPSSGMWRHVGLANPTKPICFLEIRGFIHPEFVPEFIADSQHGGVEKAS